MPVRFSPLHCAHNYAATVATLGTRSGDSAPTQRRPGHSTPEQSSERKNEDGLRRCHSEGTSTYIPRTEKKVSGVHAAPHRGWVII